MANESVALDPEPSSPTSIELDPEPEFLTQGQRTGATVGQLYKDYVAGPVTSKVAQALQIPLFLATASYAGTKPGTLSKTLAGMVVPQTPTEAALMYSLPGLGKYVGEGTSHTIPIVRSILNPIEKAISESGPVKKAILGGVVRTPIAAGIGAGTSAVTGGSPMSGAVQGAAANIGGELLRGARNILHRDVIPIDPHGLKLAQERFEPAYKDALIRDMPALDRILGPTTSNLSELITLKSPSVVGQVGRDIYRPIRSVLTTMLPPNTKFTFPFVLPGRPILTTPAIPPELRVALYNKPLLAKILEPAAQLTPNQALDVLQQLKDIAWKGDNRAVSQAAHELVGELEKNFVSVLNHYNPRFGAIYKESLKQYRQLKGLESVIKKYSSKLFPGAEGGAAGLNPVAWREVLRDMYGAIPSELFPTFHNTVSFGGELGSGATTIMPRGGSIRAYNPLRLLHASGAVYTPEKQMLIPYGMHPLQRESPGPTVWPRYFPPAIMSGLESALGQER